MEELKSAKTEIGVLQSENDELKHVLKNIKDEIRNAEGNSKNALGKRIAYLNLRVSSFNKERKSLENALHEAKTKINKLNELHLKINNHEKKESINEIPVHAEKEQSSMQEDAG